MIPLFIISSRNRPEYLTKTLEAIRANTEGKYYVCVGVDEDDIKLKEYESLYRGDKYPIDELVVFNQRDGDTYLSVLANTMYEHMFKQGIITACDVIVPFADDIIIKTPKWNLVLANRAPKDHLFVAYPFDGFNFACTIPMISREIADIVGFIAPAHLKHWYCDTWWGDVAARAHRIMPMPELLFWHLTPMNPISYNEAPNDYVFQTAFRDGGRIIMEDKNTYFSEQNRQMMAMYASNIHAKALELAKKEMGQ